eukprot:Awhi_evm1s1746
MHSKATVIAFDNNVRVLQHERPASEIVRLPPLTGGGGTDFNRALSSVASTIQTSRGRYHDHLILFYTDGHAAYPTSAIQQLASLRNNGKKIDLFAISEGGIHTVLAQIVRALHPGEGAKHLRSFIAPSELGKVFSEIIQL